MIDFEKVKIGEMGRVITGRTPKTSDPENFGNDFMFIGPSDLHKHFFITSSEKMITNKGLKSIKSATIDGLSICVGCIGWDMGNIALVQGKCATNQQINTIANINNDYNPYYIYYWLKGKKEFLFQQASVTRTPILNKTDFSNIEVSIPNKGHQNKVVHILTTIDKKIELNNKINAELEAMAKLIYDYWFVQFDFPDAIGKPYKSSGGKMVYNEALKREIPEGWRCEELGRLGDFKNGVNYDPSKPGSIACPIVNVRNISATSYFLNSNDLDVIYLSKNDAQKYAVDKDDIIIARSGIPGATRLFSYFEQNTIFCGFAIRYKLAEVSRKNQIFFFMKSVEERIKSGSAGTILKNVNQGTLKNLLISIPANTDIQNEFNKIINPTFCKIVQIQKENQQLTELRDWLLPMLMNGQVSVKDS